MSTPPAFNGGSMILVDLTDDKFNTSRFLAPTKFITKFGLFCPDILTFFKPMQLLIKMFVSELIELLTET